MANKVEEVLGTVTLRNDFYQDKLRKVLLALSISIIVILAQALAIAYIVTHPPQPQYFATTVDGQIMPLQPLDQPNLSKSALLQWANTAAIAAYTYDFVTYRQALQEASNYFTPDGWNAFMMALNNSGSLQTVLAKKLVVSAVATGAPVVVEEQLLDGRYTWKIQMKMLVTYQSPSEFSRQTVTVTMLVTRVPTLSSAKGVGIAQFLVSTDSADN